MSTLVKSLDVFKKHVTINYDFDFNTISPYIKKNERKYIKSIIGKDQLTSLIEAADPEDETLEVKELLQEAVSNLAMLEFTNIGMIQISDNGFLISTNQNAKAAEWWQIRDLRRSLLDSGLNAIDEALQIMEANPSDFSDWTESDQGKKYNSFFVRNASVFQEYYNINSSRLTFFSLLPYLKIAEDKYFVGALGEETIQKIKAAATDQAKKALEIAAAAQVHLALSEITNDGVLKFTASGLYNTTYQVPGEKIDKLPEIEVYNFHRNKQNAGVEYLKKLVQYITQEEATFTEFANKTQTITTSKVHNTGGIVSF